MRTQILSLILLMSVSVFSIEINPKFASLTANGSALKINVNHDKNKLFEIVCSENLQVVNDSLLSHPEKFNPEKVKAWVAVKSLRNNKTDTCHVSIVPWVANLSV